MKPLFVVTVEKLSRTFLVVTIARFLNSVLGLLHWGCVADRYSGSVSVYSRKRDKHLYVNIKDSSCILLNIGAGSFKHPSWTNVDLPSSNSQYARVQGQPGNDFIPLNLANIKSLPFRTRSVTAIYTSHCIEHLSFEVVERVCKEFYRTLLPGGVLRVSCPDAEMYATLCISGWKYNHPLSVIRKSLGDIHAFLLDLDEIVLTNLMSQADTADELLTRISYLKRDQSYSNNDPSNHVSWWTRVSLLACICDAGFKTPLISVAGKSSFPPMTNRALFDNTLSEMSIIIEAVKPTSG